MSLRKYERERAADAVLEDALREAGFSRVTLWHLRCVEAWAAQGEETGFARAFDTRARHSGCVEMRLRSDLYVGSLDALHGEAQWEDARRTAQRQRGPSSATRFDVRGMRLLP